MTQFKAPASRYKRDTGSSSGWQTIFARRDSNPQSGIDGQVMRVANTYSHVIHLTAVAQAISVDVDSHDVDAIGTVTLSDRLRGS
jgi:hypothetical protein